MCQSAESDTKSVTLVSISEPVLHRYECGIKDAPWGDHWTTIHAFTRGQAKSEYWRDVREAWQNIPYTAVRCRGPFKPCDTPKFLHTANYRKIDLHIGDPVEYKGQIGRVVDSNSSANFTVLFPDGQRMSFHPSEIPVPNPPEVSRHART